jgi:curli biogenesis system outer membrane secretion channel CsgG
VPHVKTRLIFAATLVASVVFSLPANAQQNSGPPSYAVPQQQSGPRARVAVYGISEAGLSRWWATTGAFDPADAIADLLTHQLVNSPSFTVIDRSVVQQALQAQNVQVVTDVDAGSQAQIARAVGANYLILGRIIQFDQTSSNSGALGSFAGGLTGGLLGGVKVGSQKISLHLNIRVVNARTGEIVQSIDEEDSKSGSSFSLSGIGSAGGPAYSSSQFTSSTIGQVLTTAVTNLAAKIDPTRLAYVPPPPPIHAKILGVDGPVVYLNAGQNRNVIVGSVFNVFETKEFMDPDTHKPLVSRSKRGTITFTSVDTATATAKVVEGSVKTGLEAVTADQ